MAGVWLLTHLLPLCLAFDSNLIKVPQSGRIAGVFMIPEGGKYIFNSTDARAACLFLNVTIATRAQMEEAILHGLQLCRYGWMDGGVAAIPRTSADPKCGKNKVGLATWNANAHQLFGAFCFNAADVKSSTTKTVSTRASTTASSPARSKPSSTPSTTEAPRLAPRSSAAPPLVQSTPSAGVSSTSPPLKSISSFKKASVSHPVTSSTSVIQFASSPSVQASTLSIPSTSSISTSSIPSTSSISTSSIPSTSSISTLSIPSTTNISVLLQPVSSAKASLGAFLVLGIILLLLTAAGVAWYYKLKRSLFPFWPRGQQKDDIETEMWKHTDSEMDLHSHQGGEEEETDRKYSSDVTLCVNPDIKTAAEY